MLQNEQQLIVRGVLFEQVERCKSRTGKCVAAVRGGKKRLRLKQLRCFPSVD